MQTSMTAVRIRKHPLPKRVRTGSNGGHFHTARNRTSSMMHSTCYLFFIASMHLRQDEHFAAARVQLSGAGIAHWWYNKRCETQHRHRTLLHLHRYWRRDVARTHFPESASRTKKVLAATLRFMYRRLGSTCSDSLLLSGLLKTLKYAHRMGLYGGSDKTWIISKCFCSLLSGQPVMLFVFYRSCTIAALFMHIRDERRNQPGWVSQHIHPAWSG